MKNHVIQWMVSLGIMLSLSGPARAQNNAFDRLRTTYEKGHADIEASKSETQAKALKQYEASLAKALDHYRKAGNLDPMLLIKKEQLAISGSTLFPDKPTDGLPASVTSIHRKIQRGLLKQTGELDRRLQRLQKQYLGHLNRLKTEFTQKNKLSEAIKIRDEMERIKTSAVEVANRIPKPEPVAVVTKPAPSPIEPSVSGGLPKNLRNDLVLYFPFDKKSELGEDKSRSKNDGDARGLTFVKEGKVKGCANFQGGSLLVVPHHDAIAFTDTFTISVWFRLKHALKAYYRTLEFASKTSKEGVDGYWFVFDGPKNGLKFRLFNPEGAEDVSWPEAIEIQKQVWHHVAVTCTGKELTLYVDGKKTDAKTLEHGPLANPHDLIIGYHMAGDLDEMMFFKSALSASEIQLLYAQE